MGDQRPLRELIQSQQAGAWGGDAPSVGAEAVAVLRATNLRGRSVDYASAARRFVSRGIVDKKRLREGDLILEASGGGPGVPVGRVARFQAPDDGRAYLVSNFFRSLRPRTEVSSAFLAHLLAREYEQPSIWSVQQQTTGLINLKLGDYLDRFVFAPPLVEQRRIAEILDTLDATIAATDRVIEKLRRRREALRSVAVQPADEWVRRPLHAVVQSAVDGPFGSMLKSTHYVDPPGRRVVRLANLGDGEFLPGDAFISEKYAAQLSRHEVEEGDVLVASLGDENHRPGRACLYPPMPKGIVKADCFRLRPDVVIADPYFLALLINSETYAAAIRRLAQGVTRDRVNLGNLLGLIVALPKPETQRAWVHRLVAADSEITVEVKKAVKLRAIRVGLGDDLLGGRVRTVPA